MTDRLAGAVWGHLVADALGVPYEFTPPALIREVHWGHSGSHHQPPGTWSDDGGLMLALLDSLLSAGFDPEDQARRAVAWMDGPDYKPGPRFDIGNATRSALHRVKQGAAALEAGGRTEQSNGNGSLMRILPVALVGRNLPPSTVAELACQASRVTHAHPISQATCAVYCLLVQSLLYGTVERETALDEAFRMAEERLSSPVQGALSTVRGYRGRSGSGYVVDTLWSAWEAFADSSSYEQTVESAIRYGHDTDTTACVAGGLAGVYWGLDGIPSGWRDQMRGQDIAGPLVARLVASEGSHGQS